MVDNPQARATLDALERGHGVAAFRAGRSPAETALLERALARRAAAEAGGAGLDDALAVTAILDGLDLAAECLAAALLWTPPRPPELSATCEHGLGEGFGSEVAALVAGAARMEAITGWSAPHGEQPVRGEGVRRLLLAMVEDPRVVLMALAERLHRLRGVRALADEQRRRSAAAAMEVWAPLASRLGVWQLKWELEDLAFRELEPATYHGLAKRLQERRVDRERYIERVVEALAAELAAAGLAADISGRPKHLYSIWRKMQHKALEFERVFDVRAVRVLVSTVAECYAALGVVHGLWTHIRGEFDDYITTPKGNLYQSLHTAVIGPDGRTLEVQIRTREMHRRAEHGVAAHWRYKEGRSAGAASDVERKVEWLRQVLAWKQSLEEPGALLHELPSREEAARVYAVTPKGEVIDLDAGATVLDFAYHVHTDVGHRCRGAKVNGAIVPLTYALRSGERVEVLTGREANPSRDWLSPHLGYLATRGARAKVRSWFKQQDYAQNLAAGRDIFEREHKRLGLPRSDPAALTARFNLHAGDDVLAALGRGDVSTGQLAAALAPMMAPADEPAPPRRAHRRAAAGGVAIGGVGDLLTQLAGCCRPVPPDAIVGYITRGRGVTIHRRDCRNVVGLRGEEQARLIEVNWDATSRRAYPVNLHVAAFDRRGLLRDVTTLIANEHANVLSMELDTDRRRQMATMDLVVEVADAEQLSRIIERLLQLPNVVEAGRRGKPSGRR